MQRKQVNQCALCEVNHRLLCSWFQIDSFEIDGVPALLGNMASSPSRYGGIRAGRNTAARTAYCMVWETPRQTVNMVRKHAPKENMAKLSLSAGSWERYRGEVCWGLLNQSGSVRGRFVMAWEDKDYFYDVSTSKHA